MFPRALLVLSIACSLIGAQGFGTSSLVDDFTQDSRLNTALWQINTPAVAGLANALVTGVQMDVVPLNLAFSQNGMTVSGVTARRQFAGIQSRQTFIAPFTVRATVMGISAFANPFALMVVSRDTGRFLNVFGNLNPGNGAAYKLGVNSSGLAAEVLDPRPSVNRWYTLEISVDATGTAAVSLADESGAVYRRVTDLEFSTDPSYVVLSQNEFGPRQQGPNVAVWRNITVQAVPVLVSAPESTSAKTPAPSRPPAVDPWIESAPSSAAPALPTTTESSVPASSPRINLTGEWNLIASTATTPGLTHWINQRGDDVTISLTRDLVITPPGFRGKYLSNPVIQGMALDAHGGTTHWAERQLVIQTPDRLILIDPAHREVAPVLFVRVNARDITCTDQAKQSTEASTAFQYGLRAYTQKDYRTALCWFSYSAGKGELKSQLYLISLLQGGNDIARDPAYNITPDPGKAFYWALQAAQQGIAGAEETLAAFYRNGVGTLPNSTTADFWDDRAKEQRWVDQAGPSMSDGLSDVFGDTPASIENKISEASNCRDTRTECDHKIRALQNDLERARERNADLIDELKTTALRLKTDCWNHLRGACETLSSVNNRMKRLGGSPVE